MKQRNKIVQNSIKWGIPSAIFLVIFLLAGCDRASQGGPPPHRTPEVGFITIAPTSITLTMELPGHVSPNMIAEVRPQVGGILQKRLFTEGADVKAGQVLYQIDPTIYKAAYASARATLSSAKAALASAKAALLQFEANAVPIRLRSDRFKELTTDKAVSKQDSDDASAAVQQIEAGIQGARASIKIAEAKIEGARAALEMAKINLAYTMLRAPISGRIGKSMVTTGALVTASQPTALATIQQLDPIYVDVHQSTAELLRLKRELDSGQLKNNGDSRNKVKLILEDNTVYAADGILQFSDITVDRTTGSVTLRAVFPNHENILLPGMFVRAVIKEGVNEKAILVPQQGVSRDPKGNPFALVVDAENKAGFRPLVLDRDVGDKWLVSSGLVPGDKVIVEGLLMLRPGTVVKATPFDPAKSGHVPSGRPGVPSGNRSEGGA